MKGMERERVLRVGELARETGLTVRALHHYDAVGVLKPSLHSEAGYRLYTAADAARLQQVLSLRQLGFSLEAIRDCLQRRRYLPAHVIRAHAARLREQIDLQQALCRRLEALAARCEAAEELPIDELLRTMKGVTMLENYYTPEQLAALEERRLALGEERMQQVPRDWEALMAEVKAEMERGTEPTAPQVLDLARRWNALLAEFTGGDPGIRESLGRLWSEQGESLAAQHDTEYDPAMFEYIGRAQAAL
jgi:DNA-binding transcriptional MerR regulator